jgi:hypothetical protein
MRAAPVFAALTVGLTSCGGHDSARPGAAEITGAEYAIVMPQEIEGGVVSTAFENTGKEVHEFVLLGVSGGRTLDDVKASLRRGRFSTPWLTQVGGVPLLSPGEETRLTRRLGAGRYVLVCTFPSRKGVVHWKLGMISEFRVSGDSGRELPEADATITAHDDWMEVPPLDAGKHVLKLVNAASEPRGFDLVTFEPENRNKIVPWASSGFKGKPPATFLGISHAVPPGTVQYAEVELEAGEIYVVLDDQSGIRHEFIPR